MAVGRNLVPMASGAPVNGQRPPPDLLARRRLSWPKPKISAPAARCGRGEALTRYGAGISAVAQPRARPLNTLLAYGRPRKTGERTRYADE